MKRALLIMCSLFFFSCEPMEGDFAVEHPVPSRDIYTYMWVNPFYPQSIVIDKGFFSLENKGTRWFESYEDMQAYFEELYKDVLPKEPEKAPEGKET